MADPDAGGSSGGGGGTLVPGAGPFGLPGFRPNDPTTVALQKIAAMLARYPGAELVDETHVRMPNGRIRTIQADAKGEPSLSEQWTAADSASYLDSVGAGSGGSAARLASDDPRYWQLQYDQLAAQYMNMGLDAESARRQALATLIANRNNTAVDAAKVSGDIAAQAAQFAANPRDAVADLMYRNAVGGSTPYGSTSNAANDTRKAMLDAKFQELFGGVGQDLGKLREYRDAIPPVEFFGPETRANLGLAPSAAQGLIGGTGSTPAAATAPANPLAAMLDRLKAMSPEDQDAFRKWTTATAPVSAAKGATLNFDGMFDSRSKPGFSPSSSEGGTNMNLHERAVVVGESGTIYATLGEKRPDGTVRAEQLQIKPLKSEVEKDKKLQEAGKAMVETQKQTMKSFATGGTITSPPGTEDFMEQLSMLLGRLGGQGGGTGAFSGQLPDIRLLAGAPENALLADPDALAYTQAGYSSQGISPDTLEATLKKFRPADARYRGQTTGRVSYL